MKNAVDEYEKKKRKTKREGGREKERRRCHCIKRRRLNKIANQGPAPRPVTDHDKSFKTFRFNKKRTQTLHLHSY